MRRASAIEGGIHALAAKLRVEPLKLRDWMEGSAAPPSDVFLKALEIVLERDGAPPER